MIVEEKDVVLGDWIVNLVRGSKGQLSVYLSHQDGTEINYLDMSLMSYDRKKLRMLVMQGEVMPLGVD